MCVWHMLLKYYLLTYLLTYDGKTNTELITEHIFCYGGHVRLHSRLIFAKCLNGSYRLNGYMRASLGIV